MYNKRTMLPGGFTGSLKVEVGLLNAIELFQVCAADRENSDAWREFLRRYTTKIKLFINGTLRQVFGSSAFQPGSIQESDLFQNAIVRLVENDCAAMKRFSGTSENDLLAYLAVICRSSVLDTLRRNNALKRRHIAVENDEAVLTAAGPQHRNYSEFERAILVSEIVSLARHTIDSKSGHVSNRDHLVFKLHFFDGLSYSQIAQCKGINLSKAGVEKLLKRMVGRVQTLVSPGKSEETLQ
jgi:RNA polymerase sigma factor (sigma-70 family)